MPHCSGDMYFSVPMIVPTRVRPVFVPVASSSGLGMRIWPDALVVASFGPPPACRTLAMPKSSTLMLPESWMNTLSGLRSRWTMPCSCAQSSARRIEHITSTAREYGIFWPFSV